MLKGNLLVRFELLSSSTSKSQLISFNSQTQDDPLEINDSNEFISDIKRYRIKNNHTERAIQADTFALNNNQVLISFRFTGIMKRILFDK